MSLTYNDLNSFTVDRILPRAVDVVFANDPLFVRLHTRNAERITGGINIRHVITVNELNGQAMGRGDGFNIDYVNTDTALLVALKLYGVNITLAGFDELQNQSPESQFSLVESKFDNAAKTMAKLLAQAMYQNGQAARVKHMNGLAEWYDDGNTYTTVGGITRTDVGTTGTPGGLNAYVANLTSWSLKQLNTAFAAAWWGPDRPDIIVTPVAGHSRIWESVQPLKQYVDASGEMVDAGFQAFRFNGADVVVSRYIPDNHIFGLNTNYILWLFSAVPKFQFGWTGWKGARGDIDSSGQYLVACNLICPNPRTGFHLTNTGATLF